MTSPEEANKDIVKRLVAAYNDQDRETYADLVAEDAVHYTPTGDALEGKDEFIDGDMGMYETVPNHQWVIDDIVAEDDMVAIRTHFRGTAEGKVLGVDVSGNTVEAPIMEFHRLEDGQIAEVWAQMSQLRWRREAGAIADLRTQYQYLSVLNRVLRHNLRNDLAVVQATLDAARDRADETVEPLLEQAHETTEELLATADTARTAQSLLTDPDLREQELADVVESVLARARDQYPAATIESTMPAAPTVEATASLEDALWELVANACEHAGDTPHVEVVVDRDPDLAAVTITDDGPGIPAHERDVLQAGIETDLEHGSGLGLWIAQWVLEASEGDLTFAVDDGTTVRATLPTTTTTE